MTFKTPEKPKNAFRVTLELEENHDRLDAILIEALRNQNDHEELKNISRIQLKKLFTEKKILIKGQNAKAKSSINSGITYVDILFKQH